MDKAKDRQNGTTAGFIKRNLVLFLTALSFFIIGFDLTTDTAEQNNEIEFYTAILINSTSPSLSIVIIAPKQPEKTEIALYFNDDSPQKSSKLSETFQSRPPPRVHN